MPAGCAAIIWGVKSLHRELLDRERDRILDLLRARGVERVRLFGSVARGDDDALSDIDLLVELPEEASAAAELLTVLGLSEELSQLVGVHVGVASPRTLRDDVRAAALQEAIPL